MKKKYPCEFFIIEPRIDAVERALFLKRLEYRTTNETYGIFRGKTVKIIAINVYVEDMAGLVMLLKLFRKLLIQFNNDKHELENYDKETTQTIRNFTLRRIKYV